ncbi:PIN domain-containing protein [Treponema parvum]|uniref:PIN domain-containing protein n=1 Tax=Treponema parvum TaxID=138851 RepID=A0A975F0E0_9SPIR|nr:PIN domain-containing protein [Treponema parvum]QTQ12184.1 PIN domain-containing protein [Treponema parvum]QTQ15824.1 PIN domain-containing protein [Treponema parvum]
MNGNILDTNIIIHILKGDSIVAGEAKKAGLIYIPVIVLGELMFGAEKSNLKQSNKEKYLRFCLSYPLLDVTRDVAQKYGKLKNILQTNGDILPENDIWISAIAITNEMTIITKDKHFERIPDLRIIKL